MFRVRCSRFEVQDSALDVGCPSSVAVLRRVDWMLDVGCFCPPHFSISAFQRFPLPAPARSRFQPFSFCARSPLSAFCFPSFCFPSSRFQPFSFSVWPPTTRKAPVPISGLTRFRGGGSEVHPCTGGRDGQASSGMLILWNTDDFRRQRRIQRKRSNPGVSAPIHSGLNNAQSLTTQHH